MSLFCRYPSDNLLVNLSKEHPIETQALIRKTFPHLSINWQCVDHSAQAFINDDQAFTNLAQWIETQCKSKVAPPDLVKVYRSKARVKQLCALFNNQNIRFNSFNKTLLDYGASTGEISEYVGKSMKFKRPVFATDVRQWHGVERKEMSTQDIEFKYLEKRVDSVITKESNEVVHKNLDIVPNVCDEVNPQSIDSTQSTLVSLKKSKTTEKYCIPWRHATFDVITCLMVLHHVPDVFEWCIGDIRSHMHRSSLLVVREHDCTDELTRQLIHLEHALHSIIEEKQTLDEFKQEYFGEFRSMDEWRNQLESMGFECLYQDWEGTGLTRIEKVKSEKMNSTPKSNIARLTVDRTYVDPVKEQEKFWSSWIEQTGRWDISPMCEYNVDPEDTFNIILNNYKRGDKYLVPKKGDVVDEPQEFWNVYSQGTFTAIPEEKRIEILAQYTLIDPIGGIHFLLPANETSRGFC